MSKKNEVDPFAITDEEVEAAKSAVSFGSSGKICPKRNKSINEKCGVCDYIQAEIYAKKYPEDSEPRKWAKDKRAKLSWFLNVVLPENPNKSIFLEIGEKVASQIIEGIEKKGWRDIVHPHKGKGREMQISKTKGQKWPSYSATPALKQADWEIPEEVWKNVPDLTDMINILETMEFTEENYMHIKSLKNGETLNFRICPPADVKAGEKKCVIAPVFRHWGVTDGQISGEESLNWKSSSKEESDEEDKKGLDLDFQETQEKAEEKAEEKLKEAPKKEDKEPPCFKDEKFFDSDDKINCEPCAWFKPCGKAVMMK